MDRQTMTIGWLSLTALLLVIGIFVVANFDARTAQASGMMASSGRYTMIVGSNGAGQELVNILDSEAQKLLTYRLHPVSARIELTGKQDLDAPEDAAQPGRQNMKP